MGQQAGADPTIDGAQTPAPDSEAKTEVAQTPAPEPKAGTDAIQTAPPDPAAGTDAARTERHPRRDVQAREDIPLPRKVEIAEETAERLFSLLGVRFEKVDFRLDEDSIQVRIGRIAEPVGAQLEGRVYEALQFMLSKAINKRASRRSRLRLIADEFHGRQGDRIDKVAQALARKVQRLRKPIAIGPVATSDVRALSSQLQRAGGVGVKTCGEGEELRIYVSPGGGGGRRRRGRR